MSESLLLPTYSYLDLYLMGFLAGQDVPDFFLIENLSYVGSDGNGNSVWSGDRLNVTVGNHITINGPRLPSFGNSQKDFNTGFVGIVQNEDLPSLMLLERLAGVRQEWLGFWSAATGGVYDEFVTHPLRVYPERCGSILFSDYA
ncbi:MAG: hypothetical protein O7C39_01990 [Bacteroidetes bacterium]|nr:hypothetical protein [Bacteroidota bacterium]